MAAPQPPPGDPSPSVATTAPPIASTPCLPPLDRATSQPEPQPQPQTQAQSEQQGERTPFTPLLNETSVRLAAKHSPAEREQRRAAQRARVAAEAAAEERFHPTVNARSAALVSGTFFERQAAREAARRQPASSLASGLAYRHVRQTNRAG